MNINFKGRIQVTAQESTSRMTGPYFYKFNSAKQQIKLVSRKLCTVKCIQVYFFHSEWPETPAPKCYSTLQVQYSTTRSWHDQQPCKEGGKGKGWQAYCWRYPVCKVPAARSGCLPLPQTLDFTRKHPTYFQPYLEATLTAKPSA